ncbi:hypothetical protein GCM10009557_13250 [Virgisporangium ochraceum]|uniref:Uncharacterized protein n=1 Tax=Virgisporangium ochraceum TaxID=65505 RepID=A0A8J4A3P6_9ACTN|nr:hypothetical protein [Virgisporangium ochraceum]GIJ73957.1 hypothetical protein Voc01_088740 [Virgisporangium ochraceum]
MSWLHWLAPAVGVVFLGFLWAFVDGTRRFTNLHRYAPIDGVVLVLLCSVGYMVWPFDGPGRHRPVLLAVDVVLLVLLVAGSVVAVLAWLRVLTFPALPPSRREWVEALGTLPELIAPSAPAVALWRWSRPAWWCLRRPRTWRRLRRLGVRGVRGVHLVGQWFTPDQVARLGWAGPTLQLLVDTVGRRGWHDVDRSGWDAGTFIRTVHAAGRPSGDYVDSASWRTLFRLGVDDTTEFVRYAAARDPRVDLDVALRYGLGGIPYDVYPTLHRALDSALDSAGARPAEWQRLLDQLVVEATGGLDDYLDGWTGLAAWVEHDGAAYVESLRRTGHTGALPIFERWRSWRPVATRAPDVQPALWSAAGLSVEEALAMLDAGAPPDGEVLAGLAALRADPGSHGA